MALTAEVLFVFEVEGSPTVGFLKSAKSLGTPV